ncbi:coiled-coil domain-containing 14-like isoform X2 [Labeo rohita]|uniref:Coiled-coil domain-containing 14-like isoform X2 n=1 Tax=Labeo rohita TaxID=84645 RepID=A0A498NNM1_LABRO|nr:coiled-coil domain-containing 14-like isoform X2 [Labeo rohita]
MARQGVSRPKVVSSGRLTASGRGQIHKKRVVEPAYSLYSTDSEDQVTTIHKGLDRCAALLNGILQAEQAAESKPKPQGTKTCTFKSKTKNLSRKIENDRKKHGKKTNTVIHANKRPAPVKKTVPSANCHPSSAGRHDLNLGIRRVQVSQDHPSGPTPVTQAEHEQQNSLPLACSQPAASCNIPSSVLETQVSNQVPSQSQTNPDGPVLIICSDQEQEIHSKESSKEGGMNAEDEHKDGMDTTPVRDISTEKLTVLTHKANPTSPEKTAQKVMTVKYLLGELKTLVANQDSDAVRLISEVEQSISLLPVMVGSTNIQAEIALALQPLRSENVQLRRRLRILNQQLLEKERAERRNRPEACDMEEVSEALAEMQNCQSKLGKYEIEKPALTLSLQQREAEISRLQEVIR